MPFGPLFRFELVRLARRGTHLPLRVALALLLLAGLLATYLRFTRIDSLLVADTANPRDLDGFGEAFLAAFLIVQQAAVLLLTPVYAGGAVAEEKERGRMDFLLTAPLSAWEVVGGKLAARLVFVLAVVAVGLPVLLLTLLFGGVSGERVLAGFAVSGVTAVSVGAFAVMLSVLRHTLRDVLLWAFGGLVASAVVGLVVGNLTTGHAGAVFSTVTVLWPLLDAWDRTLPVDPTWGLVGQYAAIHLPLALLFVLVAVAKVRTALPTPAVAPVSVAPPPVMDLPAALPPVSPEPPLPAWYKLPEREAFAPHELPSVAPGRGFLVPVLWDDEDPLAWKERHFGGRLPLLEGQWFATLRGCAVAAFLFALGMGLFIGLLIAMQSGYHDLQAVVNPFARVFLVAAILVVPMAGVRAAVGVTEERGKKTLDSLFALPVERADILRAKWRAAVRRSRWVLGSMAAVLFMGTMTGGIHPAGAVTAGIVIAGFTVFCVGLGSWLSVRCASSVRAVLWLLAVVLGVFVGPLLIGGPVAYLSPPAALFEGAQWTLLGTQLGFRTLPMEAAAALNLVVGGGYAVAGALFGRLAVRRFEREGRD